MSEYKSLLPFRRGEEAFKDDFDKLRDVWSELSLEWKIITAFMLSMQMLSIASIGGSILKFKGFILIGIGFYRTFTQPLVDLFVYFGLEFLDRDTVDGCVFITIFAVSYSKLNSKPSSFSVFFVFGLLTFLLTEFTILHFFSAATVVIGGWLCAYYTIGFAMSPTYRRTQNDQGRWLDRMVKLMPLPSGIDVPSLSQANRLAISFFWPFVVVSFVAAISNALAA